MKLGDGIGWVALLGAVWVLACASFGAKTFASDAAYKQYVAGLALSGLTGQAAAAKAQSEGYACQTVGNVIAGSAEELVLLCRRAASSGSCQQDQTIVLRLDWVGTPKASLAPGMRVRDVGSVLGQKGCG